MLTLTRLKRYILGKNTYRYCWQNFGYTLNTLVYSERIEYNNDYVSFYVNFGMRRIYIELYCYGRNRNLPVMYFIYYILTTNYKIRRKVLIDTKKHQYYYSDVYYNKKDQNYCVDYNYYDIVYNLSFNLSDIARKVLK